MDDVLYRWAASGLMALTGLPDVPLGPPEGFVEAVDALGRRFGLDGLGLLGERASLMGLWRRGSTSCGGSCRLFPTGAAGAGGDGGEWLAVSLPRDEDVDLVPAWLELDGPLPLTAPATWSAMGSALAGESDSVALLSRALLLGLPVARVGEVTSASDADAVRRVRLGDAAPTARPLVVDLSSLWAGPLCGDLLAGAGDGVGAGASVVKVESTGRPDGARRGPATFFDLLNGRKRSMALDLKDRGDVETLKRLLQRADVVIEASRPRALEQLGISAADMVRGGGPQVWVSITGYGRGAADGGEGVGRVAFGDDAAAAGGLVVWHDGSPLFCADAVADPLSGLTAAAACLDALQSGGRWMLDVSMSAVAASFAGPTLPVPAGTELTVAEPRARRPVGRAAALGADTAAVLTELGLDD